MRVDSWVWKVCRECRAPHDTRPLPEGWSYTVGRRDFVIRHVTPHLPGCRRGFKRVEIPDG